MSYSIFYIREAAKKIGIFRNISLIKEAVKTTQQIFSAKPGKFSHTIGHKEWNCCEDFGNEVRCHYGRDGWNMNIW